MHKVFLAVKTAKGNMPAKSRKSINKAYQEALRVLAGMQIHMYERL